MNRRTVTLLLGAILLACTAGVYSPTRHFQFINLDDYNEVSENPLLHPPTAKHLEQLWAHPYLKLYGPLTYSLWWAMSRVPDLSDNPAAFHVLGIGLHLICAVLVFSILIKCVKSPVAAFAGATLFAIHPIQVESVAWIAETNNLLAAALSLAAIRIYLDATEAAGARRWILYSAASAAYLLALFAKPTAVVTPILAAILAIGVMRNPRRRTILLLLPWLLATGVFSAIAHQAQSGPSTRWSDRPIVAVDAMAFYLGKLIWPAGLGLDYARTPKRVLENNTWVAGIVVVAAVTLILWLLRKRQREMIAAGLIMFAGLFPVLGLVPFAFQEYSTVADRFIYLAMLGPALALAAILAKIRWQRSLAIAAVIGLVLTWLTAGQLAIWRDTDSLIRHTLALDPGSALGNAIAGSTMERVKSPAESARYLMAAIARDPTDGDYHFNLGNAWRDMGKYPESIAEYQRAMELWSTPDPKALLNMGVSYAKMGRPDLARKAFQRVLDADPNNPQAAENLRILSPGVPTR